MRENNTTLVLSVEDARKAIADFYVEMFSSDIAHLRDTIMDGQCPWPNYHWQNFPVPLKCMAPEMVAELYSSLEHLADTLSEKQRTEEGGFYDTIVIELSEHRWHVVKRNWRVGDLATYRTDDGVEHEVIIKGLLAQTAYVAFSNGPEGNQREVDALRLKHKIV